MPLPLPRFFNSFWQCKGSTLDFQCPTGTIFRKRGRSCRSSLEGLCWMIMNFLQRKGVFPWRVGGSKVFLAGFLTVRILRHAACHCFESGALLWTYWISSFLLLNDKQKITILTMRKKVRVNLVVFIQTLNIDTRITLKLLTLPSPNENERFIHLLDIRLFYSVHCGGRTLF